MFRKQPSKPQNRIDSLIGAGTKIEGNINFAGGLRVDGEVIGNVTAVSDEPSTLVLSEQARIEGEIKVSHLVVNGEITGPVYVAEFVEIQSRSRSKETCITTAWRCISGPSSRGIWCTARARERPWS